jgi:hypothetical protein
MRLGRTIFAAIVAATFVAGPARAASAASIAGTVTDTIGAPIEGICVIAEGSSWGSFAETDAEGHYVFTDLEPDYYKVRFYDCHENPTYVGEWYDDKPTWNDADYVRVDGGESVGGIDAQLTLGGFITGTLTDESGAPAQACVAAYVPDNPESIAWAFSDSSGAYRLGPLVGDARVHFADCGVSYGGTGATAGTRTGGTAAVITPVPGGNYVQEWYDDAPSFDDATVVPVASGIEIPGIDAQLMPGASISGVVRNEAGTPIENACVDVVGDHYWASVNAWNGSYYAGQLPPGSYKVGFWDCGHGVYTGEWWNDQLSYEAADPIDVAKAAVVTHIDAVLAKRPRPDFAVTKLDVNPVPLRTDAVTLPGLGFQRTVDVSIANLGALRAYDEAYLTVWAEMRTDHARIDIASETLNLDPSQTRRYTFEWNGFGSLGDATVHASVCVPDDADPSNNHREARSYVLAGGVGIGFSLADRPSYTSCPEIVVDPPPVVR